MMTKMKKTTLVLALALALIGASRVDAQSLRPGAFSSVSLTDSTANALLVGCIPGSVSTCNGGIRSGTIQATGHYTVTATNTYDVGESARRIRKLWVTDIDAAGTISGSIAASSLSCTGCVGPTEIAATAVAAGSYGSATAHTSFTVDADGRLTAAANVTPQLTLTSTYFSSLSGSNLTGSPTFTDLLWSTTAVMSWVSKSTATNYTAASDGFVVAIADCSGGGGCTASLSLLSDTSATPTTLRGAANTVDGQIQSAMMPVKKTDKYRVNTTTGGGAPVFTVYWVPLGLGG